MQFGSKLIKTPKNFIIIFHNLEKFHYIINFSDKKDHVLHATMIQEVPKKHLKKLLQAQIDYLRTFHGLTVYPLEKTFIFFVVMLYE